MKLKKIPISDLTKSVTVTVTITGCNAWRIKKYIGTSLIKLGIYVMGMNTEIKD